MNAIESPWPFVLEHITADDEKLTGVGLLPKAYLQGLVSAMSAELHHPCMIAEFPPCKAGATSQPLPPPVEQRSRGKNGDVNPACLCFQALTLNSPMHLCGQTMTTGKQCCDFVDANLFNLFRDLTADQLTEEMIHNRMQASDCFSALQSDKYFACGIKTVKVDGVEHVKPHFEFECTWFPYLCIIVPIVFEGKVIGIQSIGQIIHEDKLPDFEAAFQQAEDRLGTKMPLVRQVHYQRAAPASGGSGTPVKAPCVLAAEQYEVLIGDAVRNVIELEATLQREMRFLRERYASARMRSYHRLLSDTITEKIANKAPDEALFQQFWDLVTAVIERVVDDFNLEFSVIFGTNTFQPKTDVLLPAVIPAGRLPETYAKLHRAGKLQFDLSRLPDADLHKLLKSNTRRDLFTCIPDGDSLDSRANFVRLTPAPLSTSSTVVTWVGYNERWNPLDQRKPYYGTSGQIVEHEIVSLYAVIVAAHAAIQAEIANENLIKQRRIFGHEISQLMGGLSWISLAMSNPKEFRAESDDSIKLMSRDIKAFCELTQMLADNAKYFVTELVPKAETFEPFGALLMKWRDTCRMTAEKRNLEFYYREGSNYDPLPRPLHADRKLLEHLIYNLIINATKYCYRGTVIELDCRERTIDNVRYHVFTVTDNGIAFEAKDPFKFGERGENARKIDGKGLGIGLFIAEKIVRAHHGWINYKSEQISRYNIPLLESRLNLEMAVSGPLMHELVSELGRLRESGIYDSVVAMRYEAEPGKGRHSRTHQPLYRHPAKSKVLRSFSEPTCKVTIEVFIPSKGEGS